MIYLFTALAMALTLPFLSYLNRKATKDALLDGEQCEMPKAYRYSGYLTVLLALAMLILPRLMKNPPEYYHPLAWGAILGVFLFGLYLMQLCKAHKIEVSENDFTIRSALGRKKSFQYDNIQPVDISLLTYFITIKDKNGQKGKVYFHLKGLLPLLKKMRSQSGVDILTIERLLNI